MIVIHSVTSIRWLKKLSDMLSLQGKQWHTLISEGIQTVSSLTWEIFRKESILVDIFVLSFNDKALTFEEFHEAFLDFCSKLNSILPGRHFCVPLQEVKFCYEEWKGSKTDLDEEDKKELIRKLLQDHAVIDHSNDAVLMTGLITPLVAMIFKRVLPDFIFVPICTVIAVLVAKMIQNKMDNDNVEYKLHNSSQEH